MKVQKRPIVIDAVQFINDPHGGNVDEVRELVGNDNFTLVSLRQARADYGDDLVVAAVWDKLHSTWVGVKTTQWVMLGTERESWPVDDAVFCKSYDILDS